MSKVANFVLYFSKMSCTKYLSCIVLYRVTSKLWIILYCKIVKNFRVKKHPYICFNVNFHGLTKAKKYIIVLILCMPEIDVRLIYQNI